jgi:hypothetical protein
MIEPKNQLAMKTAVTAVTATAAACVFAILPVLGIGCSRLPSTTGLPAGAQLVTETPDFKSGFVAPEDGTIYIYHRGDPKSYLRFSGPIKKGGVLTIDPDNNSATIDTKPLEVTVPGGNHYQVFFRPASLATPAAP